MKQRITPEQLNELTEAQKQALRDWWKPEWGDTYFLVSASGNIIDCEYINISRNENFLNDKEHKYPALSIGQMIELLIEMWPKRYGTYFDGADRLPTDYEGVYKWDVGNIKHRELCDALFEAVKQVLGG